MTLSSGRCRVLFCVMLGCGVVRGQAPESLKFEVATIKPANPDGSGMVGFESFPGGRVDLGNLSLKRLVSYAFHVTDAQVFDKTSWGSTTRYNIIGLPDADSPTRQQKSEKFDPDDEQRAMLRSLLVERFGLRFHVEQRQMPVYVLSRGSKPLLLVEPKHPDSLPRAAVYMMAGGVADGAGFGNNVSMKTLGELLSPWLERPVVDQTGLSGSYDFRLTGDDPTNHDMVLAIVRAMDRLGLHLQAGKAPLETIVIDAASKPTEN